MKITTKLELHGAAASSSPHSILYLPDKSIMYTSNCIINIAKPFFCNGSDEAELYNVDQTLRTSTTPHLDWSRSITSLALLKNDLSMRNNADRNMTIVACSFSDGTLSLWKQSGLTWNEYVINGIVNNVPIGQKDDNDCTSITNVEGVVLNKDLSDEGTDDIHVMLLTSSIDGVFCHPLILSSFESTCRRIVDPIMIGKHPTCTIKLTKFDNQILLAVGTALPRHNRIHFYTLPLHSNNFNDWKHQGAVFGHLDWISCLDWTTFRQKGCMLASGSQDARIRLWRFHSPSVYNDSMNTDVNTFNEDDSDQEDNEDLIEEGEARMFLKYQDDDGKIVQSAVTLEALLIGHEEQVTAVAWRPHSSKPCLISSSMDRSILIWMDETDQEATEAGEASQWAPITRVGTAGGILGGSIGSSLLGFVNALWSDNGKQIIGHGYGGAIHFWNKQNDSDSNKDEHHLIHSSSLERWRANAGITGHFRGCSDISWEITEGKYLLSAGLDQTCRLWSCLPMMDTRVWKELGRPQVHGYDLNTVACIGDGKTELLHRFVSGGDEKEARVFDAPKMTLSLLQKITGQMDPKEANTERIERAFIPSLGLSNRAEPSGAMEEGDGFTSVPELSVSKDEETENDNTKFDLRKISHMLPHERDLGVTSLWPEVRKLYGHQTEMICLATTAVRVHKGCDKILVASSCKARDTENAAIRLWDVEKNMCLDILKDGHKSTVVTMSFSNDGKYLISSGKDRRLCVWKKRVEDQVKFDLSAIVESAHKRIIWSCEFCPVDSSLIATGSRDGYVKLWRISEDESGVIVSEICRFEPASKGTKKVEPITALAFAPKIIHNVNNGEVIQHTILAIGMESGLIELWTIPLDGEEITPVLAHSIPVQDCHIDVVKKIAWRPMNNDGDFTFASCSSDNGVRIFKLDITES
jgi:elongator complex protein 2